MTGPPDPGLAQVEQELTRRWPESTMQPSLDRIAALTGLLGDPQHSVPSVHVTGTNGKTSTARMIDALLLETGLRTGRYTSPHLQSVTERICISGRPLDPERFTVIYNELVPYLDLVDAAQPHPLSFFEVLTAMAFAAFADAPVDVAVLEVGLGGRWDATNVVDAAVAVVTPIALDHQRWLGETIAAIAGEKSGIIKPGALAILAAQPLAAAQVLLRHAVEVGASVAREGLEFGVLERTVAVGGQQLHLRGLAGDYPAVLLPLYGAHQASNAACALAAVEAFTGGSDLDPELVRAGFAAVRSPGRLEVLRRRPTILVDAAHNPAGAQALAAAVAEAFSFERIIGVVGVLADKDVREMLVVLESTIDVIVVTESSSPRALAAGALAVRAVEVFGAERVEVVPRLDDALEVAMQLADDAGLGAGGAAVLVTGSIVTVGEARLLLGAGPV